MRTFFKTVILLATIQLIIFFTMLGFIMTDEQVLLPGKILGFAVKYISGFPLVLINDQYPYFFDTSAEKTPSGFILLVILNIFLQAALVFLGIRIYNKWKRRLKQA